MFTPISSNFMFTYDEAAHWKDAEWKSQLKITLKTGRELVFPVSGKVTGRCAHGQLLVLECKQCSGEASDCKLCSAS